METCWRERWGCWTVAHSWMMSWVSSSSLGLVSNEEWETVRHNKRERVKWREGLKVRKVKREREVGGAQHYQLYYKQQQINLRVKPWPHSTADRTLETSAGTCQGGIACNLHRLHCRVSYSYSKTELCILRLQSAITSAWWPHRWTMRYSVGHRFG